MVWDCANNRWQGSFTWCLLEDVGGHPDGYEPARKWVAPVEAQIRIHGNAHDRDPGGGDGVDASIYKDGELLWSRTIENGDDVGFDFDFESQVAVGDAIYFRIGQRGTAAYDSTRFSPTIAYPDPDSADWVVTTPHGDYTVPPMGWVAWDTDDGFLEYSAMIGGERAEFVNSSAYVYARSPSGSFRTIENLATDGAVAMASNVMAGTRDLHLVQATQAVSDDARYGLIELSERGDVNVVYSDSHTAFLTIRNCAGAPVDVTYGDVPAAWRETDGVLRDGILVHQVDSLGVPIGPVISWSSPSGGFDMLVTGLGESLSYRIRHVHGDCDGDEDVDLADFGCFQECFGQSTRPCLDVFDFGGAGVVDLADFSLWQSIQSGPE
jgi:hypothetical protein